MNQNIKKYNKEYRGNSKYISMKDYYKILNEIASVFDVDQWNTDTVFDKEITYQLSDIDIRTIGNGKGFDMFKFNFTVDDKMIHEINVTLASLFKTKDIGFFI